MIQLEVLSPSYNKLSVGSSVPIGQRGLVHVWGKNDMATSQVMIIAWVVKDPTGLTVESYSDDAGTIGSLQDHEFIGGRFDLDKLGTYTIAIELFMNRDAQVLVASYEGALCTTTTEVPPEFKLLEETIYPYAYIYDGPDLSCTFTFTTIPFTPASWIAGGLASRVENEVRKSGGRITEMRVYVDEDPWRPWTNWRIEAITVPPKTTAGTAIPLGITWWAAAILAALAIILILVITWSAKEIAGIFKRKVGLEDVKPSWGKETLIGTIQDSEEYWERPPTPLETLGAMSEAELREYLDKIAEEEVPLGVDWLPWAIAGGVGVLAVGTVAVLAARKKK